MTTVQYGCMLIAYIFVWSRINECYNFLFSYLQLKAPSFRGRYSTGTVPVFLVSTSELVRTHNGPWPLSWGNPRTENLLRRQINRQRWRCVEKIVGIILAFGENINNWIQICCLHVSIGRINLYTTYHLPLCIYADDIINFVHAFVPSWETSLKSAYPSPYVYYFDLLRLDYTSFYPAWHISKCEFKVEK